MAVSTLAVTVKARYGHKLTHLNTDNEYLPRPILVDCELNRVSGLRGPAVTGRTGVWSGTCLVTCCDVRICFVTCCDVGICFVTCCDVGISSPSTHFTRFLFPNAARCRQAPDIPATCHFSSDITHSDVSTVQPDNPRTDHRQHAAVKRMYVQ